MSDSAISVQPPLGRLPARGSFGGSNAPSYPTQRTVSRLWYSPQLFADSGILLIFPLITRSSYPFQLVTLIHLWIVLLFFFMSLTLARSERVQNLLTHANFIELVCLT